jgi:hypothetical protein
MPSSAQYVTGTFKFRKKSKNMPVWLSKLVLPSIFVECAEAGKRHKSEA